MKNLKFKLNKKNIPLILILILSAMLNLINLGIEGYGNQYYAAGVKSMTMSLKNFFFVSFDPAGFVSIDKPPLGFWIQAISAKIFGYSGWSIIFPQAIAGVVSVAVIYKLVKKSFGNSAGLISALCLAITPVFVAVSRNNTIDNLLVMTLLFACLAISKAVEKGKAKYVIMSLVLVGIGFNIKMLQAYMVVPAIYITYLICANTSVKKKLVHLTIGTVILLTVSFSWAFIVDLVPASSRPYVDSSTNNTVMELIIGHNGLERLGLSSSASGGGKPSGTVGKNMGKPPSSSNKNQSAPPSFNGSDNSKNAPWGNPPGLKGKNMNGAPGGKAGGNSTFGGTEKSSITRLFSNNSLSDQIIWLLPVALFGTIAAFLKEKGVSKFKDRKRSALLLWSMWLIPVFIYFSYTTGTFHPYYLTMLAPPISALAGIGMVTMWSLYKEGVWKAWFLPIALIADGALQILILSYSSSNTIAKILIILVSLLCFISSLLLIIFKVRASKTIRIKAAAIIAFIGLTISPLVWSGTTLFYESNGSFPSAGLSLVTSKSSVTAQQANNSNVSPSGGTEEETSIETLIKYLKAHRTGEKYLLAVTSTNTYASEIIIKTGQPVMALGGFLGSDNILTLSEFKQLVAKGEIRYAIVGGQGGGTNNEISNWIEKNGTAVDSSKWSNSTKNSQSNGSKMNSGFGAQRVMQLYDLKNAVK